MEQQWQLKKIKDLKAGDVIKLPGEGGEEEHTLIGIDYENHEFMSEECEPQERTFMGLEEVPVKIIP